MKQHACTIRCCLREQTGLSRWLAQTAAVLTFAHVEESASGLLLGTQTLVVTLHGTFQMVLYCYPIAWFLLQIGRLHLCAAFYISICSILCYLALRIYVFALHEHNLTSELPVLIQQCYLHALS